MKRWRTDPTEEHLWEAVLLYVGVRFKTYSGLPFTYEIRKGRNGQYTKELWIDRREKSKSLAWSSVLLALGNIKKVRLTQQEIADRAKITLRQYQRLESGERSILTCSFGLACRVIEALNMDVSKFYHGDYYLEEVKTMRGKGIASRKKSSI